MRADAELGGHEALILEPGQHLAELDRDGHPTLFVDTMLEVASEHSTSRSRRSPSIPRLHHSSPLSSTRRRRCTPGDRVLSRRFLGRPLGTVRQAAAARVWRPRERGGPGSGRPNAARRRRSVSRILSPRPTSGGSSHSSGPAVARGIERRTRGTGGPPVPDPKAGLPPTPSCSGWGLPSVRPHERTWRALTSPFHPCRGTDTRGGLFSVALSPGRPGPPLAATLPCGVRTFLPPVRRAAARPPPARGARRCSLFAGLVAFGLPEQHALAVGAEDQRARCAEAD